MSAEEEKQPGLRVGPDPDAVYPIKVQYCGNCSLPIEVIFITSFYFNIALDKHASYITRTAISAPHISYDFTTQSIY